MGHKHCLSRFIRLAPPIALLAVGACSFSGSGSGGVGAVSCGFSAPFTTPERIPIGQLPDIDMPAVLAHTKTLSSDEFEGRAPGTKGEQLTVAYITDQFKSIGLKPGNTDGTYIQKVPLVGITPTPASLLVIKKGAQSRTLKWKDDVVA